MTPIPGQVPGAPGTYLLQLALSRTVSITTGKLGRFKFCAGSYYYVGSAFGPGGLKARIRHHLNGSARLHWHIDYLSPYFEKVGAIMVETNENLECVFSSKIKELPFYLFEVERFGSSDCRCVSHLFGVSFDPAEKKVKEVKWERVGVFSL
jgi:Uri superfamily endonuclease